MNRVAYITNGSVAWQIPTGRIASFYNRKAYLPPEGWSVIARITDFKKDENGILRSLSDGLQNN